MAALSSCWIMFDTILAFIREQFGVSNEVIPLHAPVFYGREKEYVQQCLDSTFVSSVGKYVATFEEKVADYTGARFAVATVNGTSALHIALLLAGVKSGEEVITQAVSFVATANAISYCGADPVFLDSDNATLGLSPVALEAFLKEGVVTGEDGKLYNGRTGKRVAACVPMHVFGHPVKIELIKDICERYNIPLVEDAAEGLGSRYADKHVGRFGRLGVLSFNGNKIVTCGGGGMILTDDSALAEMATHLTTTAKLPHATEFVHDRIGYNYRMPNLNAALGCAQLEELPGFIDKKRKLAERYQAFFQKIGIPFISEPEGAFSNYWLNAILFSGKDERDAFITYAHQQGVMVRPLWRLLPKLAMYQRCLTDDLHNAKILEERIVNLPSSVIP